MKETIGCAVCGRAVEIKRYAKGNGMAKCGCGQTAFFNRAALAAFDAAETPPSPSQPEPTAPDQPAFEPEPKKNQPRTLWERLFDND